MRIFNFQHFRDINQLCVSVVSVDDPDNEGSYQLHNEFIA